MHGPLRFKDVGFNSPVRVRIYDDEIKEVEKEAAFGSEVEGD